MPCGRGILAAITLSCFLQHSHAETSNEVSSVNRVGDFSAVVADVFDSVIAGAEPAASGSTLPLQPVFGNPLIRKDLFLIPTPVYESNPPQRISQAVTLIMWVALASEQPSSPLCGFGERDGAYLTVATDNSGAPVVILSNGSQPLQVCRAERAAANLCDDRLHSLVVIANMSSGLIRIYVDGAPEAASTSSLWRPRTIDRAFAFCQEGSGPILSFGDKAFVARVIEGELSEDDIARMKPPNRSDMALLSARPFDVESRILTDLLNSTLIEFVPPGNLPKRKIRMRDF